MFLINYLSRYQSALIVFSTSGLDDILSDEVGLICRARWEEILMSPLLKHFCGQYWRIILRRPLFTCNVDLEGLLN